jgi:type IX secretion system PorP/SprF family membrane protein
MKSITTVLFLSLAAVVAAQHVPSTTLFWNNYSYFNPAMTGLEYRHQAAVNCRSQWNQVTGAPSTLVAGYNARIAKLHGGLGITGMYQSIGYNKVLGTLLNYSFHWKLAEESVLAFGGAAGIFSANLGNYDFIFPAEYENIGQDQRKLTANAGVAWHFRNLNTGFSIVQMNRDLKKYAIHYSVEPEYLFFADYLLRLSENASLRPAVLFRTDGNSTQTELSIRGVLKNKYWAGVSYRTPDAICFMAGWDIKERYRIGYAYDLVRSKLYNGYMASHEIALGFLLR